MITSPHSTINLRAGIFYDRFSWLYPVVDVFCAPGRRRLIRLINQAPAGHLLDIGAGPGYHLPLYRGHTVAAVDCSARMAASCRRRCPAAAVHHMDAEALDFPAACFDYAVLCHVLSVTENPSRMLAEALRVVRPGGRLYVLNHETPHNVWRHVDQLLIPLARRLHFRSSFRLSEISCSQPFRATKLAGVGGLGLFNAYRLER